MGSFSVDAVVTERSEPGAKQCFCEHKTPPHAVAYTGVTSSVFSRLKERAAKFGIGVSQGPSGTVSAHGVTADYKWDADAATLSVKLLRSPYRRRFVVGIVRDVVEACGGD